VLEAGSTFIVSTTAPLLPGNRLPLGAIPVGYLCHNIELSLGAGAALVRSAGNFAEVVAHDAGYAQIKLPSTEIP
jgi:large subunit ribosomal protein L2